MMDFDLPASKREVEYVPLAHLREGSVYFTVSFIDTLGLVPRLDPFVFIGHNLAEEDEREVYFQDATSYARGARLGDATIPEGAYIISGSPDVVRVMEFEEAMNALAECLSRRQESAALVQGTDGPC